MTYVPETNFQLPTPGQHVGVLIDEIDLGLEPNHFDPSKPPKRMNRLIFAIDELGTNGQPLHAFDKVSLTRHPKGDLIKYIRTFVHPNQITSGDWDTANHIGKCVGLNIVHVVKPSGTYANIESVFPLPQTAPRLSIPVGYVRRGGTASSPAVYHAESSTVRSDQPKPVQSTAQTERTSVKEVQPLPF
jgi:hypothetical protein